MLCHRDELISQAIGKFNTVTGIQAQKEKASDFASLDCRIVASSIQTLCRKSRLERWPKDHFDLIIVDECHRTLARSYITILNHFDDHANVLGVTASPRRSDKRNLGQYFERTAAELKLVDMIHAGWLVPIVFKRLPIAIDLSGAKVTRTEYGTDINRASASEAIMPYLSKIAESVREHAGFRRCLGFAPLVETARKAMLACQDVGLIAEYIHGEDSERSDKIARFKRGEYDILWNADLLTEGYDDAGIACIVNARPTSSVSLYWQINGRGTRCMANVDAHATPEARRRAIAASEKPNLLILDFLYHNHPVCTPANLIASSDEEAKQILESATAGKQFCEQELDLIVEGQKAELAREESLRKKLESHKKRKVETLSAEEFALSRGDFSLATYEPTMKWEMAAVSERQTKYLKQAKIDPSTVNGFGHAHQLLGKVFSESRVQLASPKVVNLMRKMRHISAACGIHDFDNVTTAQQRAFFKEMNQQKKARSA